MGKIRWLHISDLHYDREMMGDWPVRQEDFPDKDIQMKKHQEEYRELCGNCYHESDYIYVNDLGEPIRPNYVSQHFKLVLKNNNLREITFHELRHTCASLLLKSGISMKDIQAWLGHSNYNTTANIYAHLESSSKEITGNAMQDNFTISANLAAREAVQE